MAASIPSPPLVDISPLLTATEPLAGATDTGRRCLEAIRHACLETGFFVAVGHGLDEELVQLFAVAHSFFALPQKDKEAVLRIDRYGYVPQSALAIDKTRQSGNTEYLDLGLGQEVDLPPIDGLESAVRSYQQRALAVGAAILAGLAITLDAGADFFASRMVDPQCRLRFLHYHRMNPGADGALPVPNTPHTDYGAITLLAVDGVPGLEVKPIDSPWIPVEAPAGSLVVNLGDMLARWTNDVYRSTPHRVVGPAASDRFSIPFFVNPDPATIVECMPSCVSHERPCGYGPVTAGEFLAARIDGTDEPYVDGFGADFPKLNRGTR